MLFRWGSAAWLPLTDQALHSGRPPDPLEVLVTKGLVRAGGQHRKHHERKPSDQPHHQLSIYRQEARGQQADRPISAGRGGERRDLTATPKALQEVPGGPRVPALHFREAFPHYPSPPRAFPSLNLQHISSLLHNPLTLAHVSWR